MLRRHAKSVCVAGLALALAGILALPAQGAMRSELIKPGLCKTTGGGKFVDIPGFPGERIDRRLLTDIRWMRRNFKIFITDGYSTSGVHAPNGEHPIGLALDIIPHPSGGRWKLIGDLAHRFEPKQNRVRPPMRWVGWNGDAGHGRGDHLHLSYMHSDTPPKQPARVVYTRKCPKQAEKPSGSGGGGGGGSGGLAPRKAGAGLTPLEMAQLAPVVVESG